MILVILAHPYPKRSRACAALLAAIHDMPALEVRSLYDLYPDFAVDRAAEQAALRRARLVIWMHPVFWYTVPALMKLWFEEVLVRGFAYGPEGGALEGKDVLWAATAGGDETAFSAEGRHRHPYEAFVPVVEQTARYCAMNWLAPLSVLGAHEVDAESLAQSGRELRARLEAWRAAAKDA
jgi:glutathione-regulated potassium-efflux system ancillary protein KefF